MKRWALGLVLVVASEPARAAGFSDYGRDLGAEPAETVSVDGSLRVRGELLHNLDLDRGPTPSGQLLFPVPVDDPRGQTLSRADLRLRTDLAILAPGGAVAVRSRLDWLDNLALGSAPDGAPSASATQRPSDAAVRVKWLYGEALTPVGLLAVGRMGNHWGLGMLANSGDCPDCDSGDAADRIAFVTPLAGHLWAAAYDFAATGPFLPSRGGSRVVDVAPSARVHTLTFAALRHRTARAIERRNAAGKLTFDYGAYASHRWQNRDVPATYLPTAQPVVVDSAQVMARGYRATALDAWLRLAARGVRVELEAAYLAARVEQPSLIPGVEIREPATSKQWGAALQTDFGERDAVIGGLDAGLASGDAAPGFGAFPEIGAAAPRPGDLDGPQARPPWDNTVNNFRFHPDYRVDRILFREIIGTVTDAGYLRPHAAANLIRFPSGRLDAELAVVASVALEPESTPGGEQPLGVEVDPTLTYRSHDGFELALEQATLFPLAGLDNPRLGLAARPAQLWRARFGFFF